ncbi:MAG: SusC/RagA family TonB-linked outer membrane protein [Bacteroidetes bacterium]|nr:MAG: SusC/RagA family TonB-linked outer membrane protein [Bacteroidota bacterium]
MRRLLLFLSACLLTLNVVWAQRTVSGTVTDAETGDALEGVAVLVKGTTVGMFTDAEGKYSLQVPASGEVLVFTYVGKLKQEIAIGGRSRIDVNMMADVLQIEEVVVTAVGIEANRRSLGYSVQNVVSDEIVNARETNLVNALNSKVAGVTVVSSSGSPGSSANIRVRGATSINGSNSPLFVIDGVPIDNSETGNDVDGVDQSNRAIDINPNDIESLTVLKGPAATVLYGIRAANGAVIITTKSGKTGKPKVTISASYTADQVNKLPGRQSLYAQGQPRPDANGTLVPTWRGPHTFEGFSWGPAIADLEFDGSEYPFDSRGRLVPRGTGNGQPAVAYDPYSFFVTGNTLDLNASVSGGSQGTTYYLSAGHLASNGVIPNATFDRSSFKARVETQLNKKLTVGMSATFVKSGGFRIQRGSNLQGVMLGLLRNTPTFDIGNGKEGRAAADDVASYELPNGEQRSYRYGVYDNPYWTINKNPFRDDVNRIIGYTSLKYEFTPWLSLSYKLGIDFFTDRRNGAFDINPGWSPGSVYQSFRSSNDLNSDLLLQFNKNLGSDLNINATLGHNFYSTQVINQFTDGFTLAAPNYYHISNAADIQGGESISQRKLVGVFGQVNLSFRDYLFLNLSARNDWSSTLPEGANSFFYPAASLGFAFTEALGMTENPILPYGKLRLSWGQVGNDAPIYATSNYFNSAFSGGDGFITGITYPAFGLSSFERDILLGNPNLRPETTTTFEVGVDLKFFSGRVGLDLTYYNSSTTDQVISVQLPSPTGFTNFVQNSGVITNTGWEGILTLIPVRTRDFEWSIMGNFTAYENIVEELAPNIQEIGLAGFVSTSSRVVVGEPYGAIWGDAFRKNDAGQLIIDDDGWPILDPNKQVMGDPNPDWLLGLRNTFSYKGLSLSALIDIRQGGDVWCGTCGIMDYFGTSEQSGDLRDQSVVFDGVNANGEVNTVSRPYFDPTTGLGSNYWVRFGFGGITEMSMYDASWVRLREVTLSYSLPKSVVSKLNMGDITLAFNGRNLLLFTQYPGIDPETNLTGASNGFGLDYFNMPNTRSYGGTIRISF